jgi:hypothetical protein
MYENPREIDHVSVRLRLFDRATEKVHGSREHADSTRLS